MKPRVAQKAIPLDTPACVIRQGEADETQGCPNGNSAGVRNKKNVGRRRNRRQNARTDSI